MTVYQNWQLRLERQPVLFLGRELDCLLKDSRQALGKYLNADADDLIYISNATHGTNIIAHSMQLKTGDEVLTMNMAHAITRGTLSAVKRAQSIFISPFLCRFTP